MRSICTLLWCTHHTHTSSKVLETIVQSQKKKERKETNFKKIPFSERENTREMQTKKLSPVCQLVIFAFLLFGYFDDCFAIDLNGFAANGGPGQTKGITDRFGDKEK